MKFRQISILLAGLLSAGALAQTTMPPINAPGRVPPANAAPAPAKPTEAPDKGQLTDAAAVYYSDFVNKDATRLSSIEPF